MTKVSDDYKIVRLRIKDADGVDHSETAWKEKKVGVWYGVWSPEELDKAIKCYRVEGQDVAVNYMKNRPTQKRLEKQMGWKYEKSFFHTCRRFSEIVEKKDWVWVYFSNTLHLGQLTGGIKTKVGHKLNNDNGELFHFRQVINQKSFPLTELPDLYRLLPQAGRGNVHQNNAYTDILKLLVKYSNPKEVRKWHTSLKTDDWLDFLSDKEWESLCLGYLIIKHDYVPTGLLPGGTLSDYDLVGKNRRGIRILAQCKNSHYQHDSSEFLAACKKYKGNEKILWFWCCYGGWEKPLGHGIKLVDKACIREWSNTKEGSKYLDIFRA